VKKSFILFFAFGITARLFPLLLIPFITRISDDAVVAEFMLFVSVSSFCCMLFLFGTQFELTRIFFSARVKVTKNIANGLCLISLIGGGVSAVVFLLDLDNVYLMGSLNGYLIAVVSYTLVYYRVSGSVLKFGVTDVFRVGIQYVIMTALIQFYEFDLLFIVLSNLSWILILLTYEFLKRRLTLKSIFEYVDFVELQQSVVRGCSILPHSISIYGLALLDKILLNEVANQSVLAQYSVGFVFGQIVLLVTDSFNKVWGPYAVKTIEEGKTDKVVRISLVMSLSAILMSPIVGFLVYIISGYYFPSAYSLSRDVAVLVSVIYVLQSIYFIVFPFLIQSGLIAKIGVITTVSSIAGAVVMFLLASNGLYTYLPIGMLVAFCGQILGIVFTVRKLI
jgi:O-antigen/teichoic acid export membrane protein